MPHTWVSLALNVAFGAIAGGVTNAVAVWMLFHPYERRFGLHGAIPKNQDRLARSIGRTVGERLLTPDDIMAELSDAGVRETFAARLTDALERVLETERGSLADLLPPAVFAEVERALAMVGPQLGERVHAFVESPEFDGRVRDFVARMRAELSQRPLAQVLTPERRAQLQARALTWAEELARSPELERGIREYLERQARDLLGSQTPMVERIPDPAVDALERAVQNYLPLAVERVGVFLGHPASRDRIREALHGLFARFVQDLRFHERVIARLVVTERTLEHALDAIERDGVEQLASLLEDPIVRDEISRTINATITDYLRKPLGELVGGAESERASALVRMVGDTLLRALRAEQTHGFLAAKLDQVLSQAEGRTVGDVLQAVDDDTIAGWIVQGARTRQVREWAEQSATFAVHQLLHRPIGRPGRWLPDDAAPRIAAVLAPALWAWVHAQLPEIVQQFDVQSMVERKVRSFSVQRMEELIRRVTQKELDLIVNLGWVLGALIGFVSFLVSQLTLG
ncbi:MAG TPA: DUF445 family protein [Gemmatimonadaceae bacterium]|nr:DUF445 family protein [Gemmatimonadaceae bacterium]